MQRYSLNMKGGTYNENRSYKLTPIYRQQVVPGTTASIDAMMNMKSSALTKLITTPSLVSMWFFYVPHRLVWDGWTDFISKKEGATAFVTTNVNADIFFDKQDAAGTALYSPLYRRAYKLVYNEYFANDVSGKYDVQLDSVIDTGKLSNPEQFAHRLADDADVVDPEFTVVANTIPLNEFYRAQMNARSKQRSQMTGDKYVDTLARMGVDASWMITDRPEFLGTKSKLCAPQLHASTESATLGEEVSRFDCSLAVNIQNKHFAEHGYIIGVAGFRPMVMFNDRGAADSSHVGFGDSEAWLNWFYSADNVQTKDEVYDRINGFNATPSNWYTNRFAYATNGQWINGSGSDWVATHTATDFADLQYPNPLNFTFFSPMTITNNQCAFTTSVNVKGRTPIPKRVA